MKKFFYELRKEYMSLLVPSFFEVMYISFLVLVSSLLVSLSISGLDAIIGSIINVILFD